MIRLKLHIFVTLCLLLVSLIYHFENKVNELDSEITKKIEHIKKAKNDITVMEAEWSFQNSPKRLTALSSLISSDEMRTPTMIHLTNIKNIEAKKLYFSQNQNINY